MEISLTRIILFGQNIEKLKNFYIDIFNFSVIEETSHQWVVLNAGSIEIALHKVGEAYATKSDDDFNANSNTKLVFTLKTDLKLFRQELLKRSVAIKEIKSFQEINSLFCDGEDPEGNVFQLEERL
jgi:catechol-2,3-dioxygenase